MRVSQLSALARTSVATIKYYRRSGLLHPPRKTARNQGQYDDTHLRRLRVIRTLIDVVPVPLAELQRLFSDTGSGLDALPGDRAAGARRLLTVNTDILNAVAGQDPASSSATTHADRVLGTLVDGNGWEGTTHSSAYSVARNVLVRMYELDEAPDIDTLQLWSEVADKVAERDLAERREVGIDPVETVLVRNLLGDVLLAALRRIAQEHRRSRTRALGASTGPETP